MSLNTIDRTIGGDAGPLADGMSRRRRRMRKRQRQFDGRQQQPKLPSLTSPQLEPQLPANRQQPEPQQPAGPQPEPRLLAGHKRKPQSLTGRRCWLARRTHLREMLVAALETRAAEVGRAVWLGMSGNAKGRLEALNKQIATRPQAGHDELVSRHTLTTEVAQGDEAGQTTG